MFKSTRCGKRTSVFLSYNKCGVQVCASVLGVSVQVPSVSDRCWGSFSTIILRLQRLPLADYDPDIFARLLVTLKFN